MAGWKSHNDRNNLIVELRKQGHSLNHICAVVGCVKSVASYHCRNIKLTNEQKNKLRKASYSPKCLDNLRQASKASTAKWHKLREDIKLAAEREWPDVKHDPIMMGFLGLYWGEGTKRSKSKTGSISIVNNDCGIILAALFIFNKWRVTNIRITVKCYPEHNKEHCKLYWEKILCRDVKIIDKAWLGKKRKMYSQHGLCVVEFANIQFFHRIIRWLDLWREELLAMAGCSAVGSALVLGSKGRQFDPGQPDLD